jgi:hypothetical protein
MSNSFGVIVCFTLSEFDLSKEEIFNAYKVAGIDEVFWPRERKPRKAFKKALQESIDGDTGFMIRQVTSNKDLISAGLVLEEKDKVEKDLNYDVKNVLTLHTDAEVIKGKTDFRTEAVAEAYVNYRKRLGSMEILTKLHELFFHSMALEVLCRKAFFVPIKYKENVDKVVVFFSELEKLHAPVEIEMLAVDNNSETRNTIVNHFIGQTLEMINNEIEFCVDQRQKFESGEFKYLRESAFRRLLLKVKALEERLRTYIQLLEMTPEEDKALWERMEQLDKEITMNIDLSQKHKKYTKRDAMRDVL